MTTDYGKLLTTSTIDKWNEIQGERSFNRDWSELPTIKGLDLTDRNLEGYNLSNFHFFGVNFSGSSLFQCSMNSNFTSCIFEKVNLENTYHDDNTFRLCLFDDCPFDSSKFNRTSISLCHILNSTFLDLNTYLFMISNTIIVNTEIDLEYITQLKNVTILTHNTTEF